MNSLLAQFVSECRDLIETASRCLLDLENDSSNKDQIDELFRAVHTIKGASGLFEFKPLTSTVHAGEDLLDAVRAGDVRFNSDIADLLLEMLDRLVEWLDQIDATDSLPAGAEDTSAELSRRLRLQLEDGSADEVEAEETAEASPAFDAWPEDVPPLPGADKGLTFVTYLPSPNAFFTGDDPLQTVLKTPGLMWMQIQEPESWPDLEALDPFIVQIGFLAVSDASQAEVEEHFSYVASEISIQTIGLTDAPPAEEAAPEPDAALKELATKLLASQKELLASEQHDISEHKCLESIDQVLERLTNALELVVVRTKPVHDTASLRETLEHWIHDIEVEMAGGAVAVEDTEDDEPFAPLGEPIAAAPEPQPAQEDVSAEIASPAVSTPSPRASSHLRVDAERVDPLMNLAGELIVAKNAMPFLAQKAEAADNAGDLVREIKSQHNTINRIAEELQAAIMQIRMVPVGNILSRFNRLVRDLSRKLGKDIQYLVDGEDTEADKAIVDELSEPVVHLIRNSIDHGIEDPKAREQAGKPRQGTIRIRAYHKEENVVLEISDDGKGIDVDRVLTKAVERGLLDQEKAANMSRSEALQLVFLPGLSTKEEVSDLSGRGVGMDSVGSMVRRMGGQIGIDSEQGFGTTVTLSLPLSMSVQRLMMVEVGDGLYSVPVDSVVESQKIDPAKIRRHRNAEMVVLRDRLIPLVRLRDLFECPDIEEPQTLSVMVVDVDGHESGLVVDKFHPGLDAIVKPMTGVLSGHQMYAGTALLGDGSILLALNLREMIECQYH
ncbi:chemotaxis protein CheA [Marivivens donghaensis]|uniref:histidine kinase n=1 Tax=Marivivens donghaensis TaxID=1699413 RepID=A0ABX0VX99_9RHOB|nr:chemotaxis protein CheA [Marivivens donghaensis]NIY72435.1 chemotaxis protein CheA [Marivivens donghaensis]